MSRRPSIVARAMPCSQPTFFSFSPGTDDASSKRAGRGNATNHGRRPVGRSPNCSPSHFLTRRALAHRDALADHERGRRFVRRVETHGPEKACASCSRPITGSRLPTSGQSVPS